MTDSQTNPVPNTDPWQTEPRLDTLNKISRDLGWHTDSRGRDVVEVEIETLIDFIRDNYQPLPQQPERTTAKFAGVVENPIPHGDELEVRAPSSPNPSPSKGLVEATRGSTPLDSGELRRAIYKVSLTPIKDIYFVSGLFIPSGSVGLSDDRLDVIMPLIDSYAQAKVEEAQLKSRLQTVDTVIGDLEFLGLPLSGEQIESLRLYQRQLEAQLEPDMQEDGDAKR